MIRKLLLIIGFILVTTSCNDNRRYNFSLTIEHYAGGAGLTIVYKLDEKSLQIDINCNLENCKQKTVYSRKFTKNEGDSIYKFLTSLQLDTLKSTYETKGMLDGLFTKLSFKKSLFSSHTSTFDNFNTPTTKALFNFIDDLITIKKYRFYSWGQDD